MTGRKERENKGMKYWAISSVGSPSVATSINAVTLGYVLGSGNTVSISFHVFG